MFNDRFDKILKRNLESVKPEYNEQAWDRISKRLPAYGVWPFIQQYGGWLLCGMMMAAWVTTLYTLRENQQMIRQLSTLQNESSAKIPEPIRHVAETKADTVYIVKRTIIEHRNAVPASAILPATAAETAIPVNIESNTVATVPVSELGDPKAAAKPAILDSTTPENISAMHQVVDQYTKAGMQDSFHQKSAADPILKPDSLKKVMDKESIIALIDSAWAQQSARQLKSVYPDSLSERNAYVSSLHAETKPKRDPFRLSDLEPRLGIESLFSRFSQGFGPAIEVFPTENFGISVGIQASTLRAENHKALRDYNSATGKLFLVQYRSYLPSRFDRIEDISIKTTVVTLPVNLKYYIPLKNNLSLFVHSGTSLDLSAYQQVSFESYLNKSKRRNTFEMDVSPHFFHEFMFGTGLQYRRSRIHAQVSPYYVYDFRNIEHTPAGSNLGFKASLWLNLSK